VKIYKAEKDGAIDDLKAYKDALMKSMVEQTREKPKTLTQQVKEKAKIKLKKIRRKSNDGSGSTSSTSPPRLSVVELQNLTFTLMEKIEEKDARIKMKEYEKRNMFDRIMKLEDMLEEFERRDKEEEEEEVVVVEEEEEEEEEDAEEEHGGENGGKGGEGEVIEKEVVDVEGEKKRKK
jgi:hypothetical protein